MQQKPSVGRLSRRSWATVLIVVVLVAAVASIFFFERRVGPVGVRGNDNEHAEPTSTESADVRPASETASRTSESAARTETVPMPDIRLPLAEQLPVLVERANAGDPAAACRLVLTVSRCAHSIRANRFTAGVQRSLESRAGPHDDQLIDFVARSSDAATSDFCDGVDHAALPRLDDLPAIAFQRMSPFEKTLVALTRSDGRLRRLQPVPGTSYRETNEFVLPQVIASNAQQFLVDAFNAGELLAIEGLVMMHAPGSLRPDGVAVTLPDQRKFLRYALLLEQLQGSEALGYASRLIPAVESQLPPDEVASIRRQVAAELPRWRELASRSTRHPLENRPDEECVR
jgi:hypothetical protein